MASAGRWHSWMGSMCIAFFAAAGPHEAEPPLGVEVELDVVAIIPCVRRSDRGRHVGFLDVTDAA